MYRRYLVILLTLFSVVGLVAGSSPVMAQGEQPPLTEGRDDHDRPGQNQEGLRRYPDREDELSRKILLPQEVVSDLQPQSIGGPDDYGYTWNNAAGFSWINAKASGVNTGLYGGDAYSGPLDIGFSFPFYENSYNQLNFSTKGLISFANGGVWWSNVGIPNPATPNNMIVAFWDDLGMYKGNRPDAGIYYSRGGSAPNRYIVIEWYRADAYSGPGPNGNGYSDLTFEIILYENGDIVMQYLSLSGTVTSATVGIEDSTGTDGLQYLYNQYGLVNGLAVRFYRPVGPVARVKAWPLYQGGFTRDHDQITFEVQISNTGNMGADTYDLLTSSIWPIALYQADGTTSLTDTDIDGIIDTGSINTGSTFIVKAKIQAPNLVNVGDNNQATLTARSSININKSRTVAFNTTIPAPFAQVYVDNSDGAMSLYLVAPSLQLERKATPDHEYGSDPAVVEAPNGDLIYLWENYRCLDYYCDLYVEEIEYSIYNHAGSVIRPQGKLFDLGWATMQIYDYLAAAAVAPNGSIGVVWIRYIYNHNLNQYNYNVYFAILNASGNLVYGPTNITNNNMWGTWISYGVPGFIETRITATGDNQFFLAWRRYSNETGGYLEDIYYAVRDTNNTAVLPPTNMTYDTPGYDQGYWNPALSALNNNRVILAWSQDVGGIGYAILGSGGSVVKPAASTQLDGWDVDTTQLSNGHIILAYSQWVSRYRTAFAMLDESYNLIVGPVSLANPASSEGDYYLSVTADQAGHAILTWMEVSYSYRPNLYYALVDGEGNVLTQPMIFRSAKPYFGSYFIETSFEGYGNTSYTIAPSTSQVDAYISSSSIAGAQPGEYAQIPIRFGNQGAYTASQVMITAELGPSLDYVSDTSGFGHTVDGTTIIWNLPNLSFMGYGEFVLKVAVPYAPDGTTYPVTLEIQSAGPEWNPGDNTHTLNVILGGQSFIPLVGRGNQ